MALSSPARRIDAFGVWHDPSSAYNSCHVVRRSCPAGGLPSGFRGYRRSGFAPISIMTQRAKSDPDAVVVRLAGDSGDGVQLMGAQFIASAAERLAGTDTLIIFTADHSYDILFPKGTAKGVNILPSMTVEGSHTAEQVVVTAQGPGADRVKGFFPNTYLFHVMMSAYGWTPD